MRDSKPPFRRQTSKDGAHPSNLRSDAFIARAMHLFGDSVYRTALAQTGSLADAEDIYQDVFIRLLKDKTAFSGDGHLKAWLLRVTVNRCHDYARSAWKRRTASLEREHADIADATPFRADIWDVVGELPDDQRTAVQLFYIEGYSTEEIARIMQCQPATVRTRLHRARQHLKIDLSPDESRPNPHCPLTDANLGKEPPHDREQRPAEFQRLPFDDGSNPRPRPSTT